MDDTALININHNLIGYVNRDIDVKAFLYFINKNNFRQLDLVFYKTFRVNNDDELQSFYFLSTFRELKY